MREKAELIVIGHTKVGENSIVLHTISREYGRRGFLVKVSPKTAMALFLPLNILEVEVTRNPKSDLWFARNFVSVNPLVGIRGNIHKNTMTLFMSEVLFRVIKDQTNEEGLMDWLKRSILTLDALQSDFANFHLWFLLELCAVLGFNPDTIDLAPFSGKHLDHIKSLLTSSFGEAMLLPLRGSDRNEIAECILKYIEHHTESSVNVRSLAVLRDIYG